MNTRTARCLALLLLAIPMAAFANNKWYVNCEKKKDCSECQTGSCEGESTSYGYRNSFEAALETALADGGECTITEVDAYGNIVTETTVGPDDGGEGGEGGEGGGGGGGGGAGSGPGITPGNYKRSGLVFVGASPDYVKTELAGGVRTPTQMPLKGATRFYTDLPDGFQAAQYPNSQLTAPDANGYRSLKPDAQPSSITIRRNPDGGTATTSGNLDIVHKQRHPQTGAWITRTTRIHAPQDNNIWSTRFYLGDPKENPTLTPYREISITRTANPGGTETTREVTKDRDTSGTLVITSDLTRTYAFYKHGEPVILTETRHTGTGSELTITRTYYHDSADQASYNKPATIRRSDGGWENITYLGNPVTGIIVTKTVSGWLDNPAPAIGTAPDENANCVVTVFEAKNETGTIGREEKIQGVTVSRTWGNRYKSKSGETVERTHEQRGSATLTTVRTGYPDDASVPVVERGRLKSIQHPDGTVTLHRHATQGENRVETIETGVGDLSSVTDGTRTVSTYTKDDVLIKQVVSDIASDVELSTRQAIAFDSNDHPSRWAYDHNLDDYSETLQGCCGIDSTRSRDGVVTTYTRDGLKRPKTAISQGITLSYTYGSKTIGGTLFPTENITATAGGLTLDKGTTVRDHAGNVIQRISPDLDGDGNPEVTTITRDFATRTTTTTNPDGGTEIETDHADGQHKSTTGTATAPRFHTYATHNDQGGGLVTAQGPAATGPWQKAWQAVGGQTFKTTFDDGTTELTLQTNTFDALARLISTKDADNVTQLLAYNAKGEAYRSAIDLNQNGQIDGNDRITDTLRDVISDSPIGNALRSLNIIYDLANNPVTVSTTFQSPDGLTTRQETLGVSNPSITTRASHLDRADGSWTDSTNNPDGTKQVTEYSNWLVVSTSSLSTDHSALITSSTTYDALRRPITQNHSRTGLVTTHYAASGLVASIDDHGRITAFAHDSMGRRIATTLPDGSVSHTSYWPTGQEKASWGSQTNPTVKLYSPQGQLTELRTFRSTNLSLAPDETTGNYDATTWTFNAREQLTRKQYADGKGIDYTHTPAGRILSRTSARGITTTYGYNTAGEPVTTDYSDTTPNVTVTFDKLGRHQSITNGYATSVFAYNPATLALTSETVSYDLNLDGTPELTRVLDRSRDNLGRNTGFQLKDGTTVENQAAYTYSPIDGRLATIRGGDIPVPTSSLFTYSYLPNSNLVATVTGPVHTVINTWEPTRDILASKQNKVGTTTISQFDYTVNALAQRTGVNTSGTAFPTAPGWAWGYDPLGQLTSADHSTDNTFDRAYQYDAIANRQRAATGTLDINDASATVYTPNALNQYSSLTLNSPPSTLNPSYDDDGNATAYPISAHPGANSTLEWDAENRLISTTVNGVATNHLYDAQFRKIATTTGGNTTLYLYDDWSCIAEYSISNNQYSISKARLWGLDLSGTLQGAGGVGGLLSETLNNQPSTLNHYPTYDGNGNISEYLDDTGAIAAHFEYDPFGNTVVNTDTGNLFAYRFSTKPLDFTTGLYYYGYRWYDPLTGRWPSRDPIEEEGGINLYGFVGNDGMNEIDFLGMGKVKMTYTLATGELCVENTEIVDGEEVTEKCCLEAITGGALMPENDLPYDPLPTGTYYVMNYTGNGTQRPADEYFGLFKVDGTGMKINDQFWDPSASRSSPTYDDDKRRGKSEKGRWRDGLRLSAVGRAATSHGCVICVPGKGKEGAEVLDDWKKIQKWVRASDEAALHQYKNNEIPRRSDPKLYSSTKYTTIEVK